MNEHNIYMALLDSYRTAHLVKEFEGADQEHVYLAGAEAALRLVHDHLDDLLKTLRFA